MPKTQDNNYKLSSIKTSNLGVWTDSPKTIKEMKDMAVNMARDARERVLNDAEKIGGKKFRNIMIKEMAKLKITVI